MLLSACYSLQKANSAVVLMWMGSCWSGRSGLGFSISPSPQISMLPHTKQRQQMTQWKKLFFPGLTGTKTSSEHAEHRLHSSPC